MSYSQYMPLPIHSRYRNAKRPRHHPHLLSSPVPPPPGCGPCQILAAELTKLTELTGGKVRVVKVDTDEEEQLASGLQIRGLPTMVFIREGAAVYRMEGALRAEQLKDMCDELFFGKRPPVDQMPIAYTADEQAAAAKE